MNVPADDIRKDDPKRRKLGRGLSALLGDHDEYVAEAVEPAPISGEAMRAAKSVPVEFLKPNPDQPRKRFDDAAIDGLVDSIREKGVLQPILVRPHPDAANMYQIVAGERRWRAAQRAKLYDVPVVIKDLSDRDTVEIALIENIHREDLTPLEEAEGYQRLMDEYDHIQESLATAVGKSRSHVANMLRLLALPEAVKSMIDDGLLSAGHGRALLTDENPEGAADIIVSKGLSVRQAEKLVQDRKRNSGNRPDSAARIARAVSESDPDVLALERQLADGLGLKVSIKSSPANPETGSLTIHYTNLDQLDDVLAKLTGNG